MGGTASGPPAWPWREGAGLPVGRGRGSRSWSRTPGCAGSVLLLVLGRGRGDSVLHAEAAHEEVDDGPVQVLPEGGRCGEESRSESGTDPSSPSVNEGTDVEETVPVKLYL